MKRFRPEDAERGQVQEESSLPAAELSDEALIRAIVARAMWAMEPLYQRYSRLLYSLAYRMVADHQVAEDLLQESFLAVWRNAASYSPQAGAMRSWLVSIIHHRTFAPSPETRLSSLKTVREKPVEFVPGAAIV